MIGMTNLQEAKLAREAEICYATLALVTDYDCWHESEEAVTSDMVVQNLLRNVDAARRALRALMSAVPAERACPCKDALAAALATRPEHITAAVKERLDKIIGRHVE